MISRLALAACACLIALAAGGAGPASAWISHSSDAPKAIKAQKARGTGWTAIDIDGKPLGEQADSGKPVPLSVGKLKYLGGLVLTSTDEYFGGFSGLRLVPGENRLYAVSDRAKWLQAEYTQGSNGAITGLSDAALANVLFYRDEIITGVRADLEGLELTPEGDAILSFEREARIDFYQNRDGVFAMRSRLMPLEVADHLPENGSFESLAMLHDGRILTIAEEDHGTKTDKPGFLAPAGILPEGTQDWQRFTYVTEEEFAPTDMMQDPGGSGEIYVLERAFSPLLGVRAKLMRFSLDALAPGAVIEPEELAHLNQVHGVDNMEGLSMQRLEDGTLVAHMISDDNFNRAQRTVLMSWQVTDRGPE